jgi:hypothetical protein
METIHRLQAGVLLSLETEFPECTKADLAKQGLRPLLQKAPHPRERKGV